MVVVRLDGGWSHCWMENRKNLSLQARCCRTVSTFWKFACAMHLVGSLELGLPTIRPKTDKLAARNGYPKRGGQSEELVDDESEDEK